MKKNIGLLILFTLLLNTIQIEICYAGYAQLPKNAKQVSSAGLAFYSAYSLRIDNVQKQFPSASSKKIKDIFSSIRSYVDNTGDSCPCPWNKASNGTACGGRSAFSKENGFAPICYPEQI